MHALASGWPTSALVGRWDAVLVVNGQEVPFPFEVAVAPAGLQASFFNGERRITSTGVTTDGARTSFRFEQYAATLHTTDDQGRLGGKYRRARGEPLPFRAVPAAATPAAAVASAPAIAGLAVLARGFESHPHLQPS